MRAFLTKALSVYIYTIVSALEGETSLSVTVITLVREEVESPDEVP